MGVVAAEGRAGTRQALDAVWIEELRTSVGEQLITPDDPRYDGARRVWNGMIDRRPAVIVRCRGVADVIASVRFARMREVRVAPAKRTARAAGGATWADVDRETQVFGLAAPGGIVSTTGIAGLTLGGGYGHLRRKYGLSCDNLVSVDIVTADGQLRTASESEHPDIFWGVR